LVICLSAVGTGYAHWTKSLYAEGVVNTGDVDIEFTDCTSSDPPGTIDMGCDKDVGWAECQLVDSDGDGDADVAEITIHNAYPGYQCLLNITVHCNGSIPVHITDTSLVHNSDPLAVALEGFWTDTNMICTQLHYCDSISASFWLYVSQEAAQNEIYTFLIQIEATQYNEAVCEPKDLGGTIGFWKNWDSHQTHTQEEIEGWLGSISGESADWLDLTTTGEMEDMFALASGGTMEEKFLGHYLATRLDGESGRLSLTTSHDVTDYDQVNYLGLTNPSAALLSEIISAIESKYGTASPEFELMKDICDGLNNLDI